MDDVFRNFIEDYRAALAEEERMIAFIEGGHIFVQLGKDPHQETARFLERLKADRDMRRSILDMYDKS